MCNTAFVFQLGKEVFIELHVIFIERELWFQQLLVLCGRSGILSQREETSTLTTGLLCLGLLFLLHKLAIALLDSLCHGIFFLLSTIEAHHALGIAQGLVHLFLLDHQFLNDSYIATNIGLLASGYQIIYVRCLCLTISVDTSVALFESNQTPRNVVVKHTMTVVVKVNTLTTGVAGDKHTDGAILFTESSHQFFLFGVGKATMEKDYLLVTHAKVLLKSALQVAHGFQSLSKDNDAFVLFLSLPAQFSEFLTESVIAAVYLLVEHIFEYISQVL